MLHLSKSIEQSLVSVSPVWVGIMVVLQCASLEVMALAGWGQIDCRSNQQASWVDADSIGFGCSNPAACNFDTLAVCVDGSTDCDFLTCTSECESVAWSHCYGNNENWVFSLVNEDGHSVFVDVSEVDIEQFDVLTIRDGRTGVLLYHSSYEESDLIYGTDSMVVRFVSDWSDGCQSDGYSWIDFSGIHLQVSCAEPPVEGTCDVEGACNYLDGESFPDPAACHYDCHDGCFFFHMSDEFGDGWNGATYTLSSSLSGLDLVAEGQLSGGNYGMDVLCINPGCYLLTVTDGSYPDEVNWSLSDNSSFSPADNFYSGGVGVYELDLTLGEGGCYGCIDIYACNYNPDATFDDNSCFTEEAQVFTANYCGENVGWDPMGQQCVVASQCQPDLSGDGYVTVSDILLFLPEFGGICQTQASLIASCDCELSDSESNCQMICESMVSQACSAVTEGLCGPGTIWSTSMGACVRFHPCPEDFNDSGDISIGDLLMLLGFFGTTCS